MDRFVRFVFYLALALAPVPAVKGGTVTATFEDMGLPKDAFLNAATPPPPNQNTYDTFGFFTDGGNSFYNAAGVTSFTAQGQTTYYPYWSGFSISSETDTTTPGFGNQYSSYVGTGAGGSQTYAVGFINGQDARINLPAGATLKSFDVTNTTYTALAMKEDDGSGFSNPYSHALGSYLKLTVTGYSGLDLSGSQTGSVDVYLADFRDPDPTKDFILDSWKTIDLTSLGNASSLVFTIDSAPSDHGDFGMNTPAYFALDNLAVSIPSAVPEPASFTLCFAGISIAGLIVRRGRERIRS